MIRTKKQVLIHAEGLICKQVYLELGHNIVDDYKNGIVTTFYNAFYLNPKQVQVTGQNGVIQTVNANERIYLYGRDNSKRPVLIPTVFKKSTWDAQFANATPSDYDELFINTIGYVNQKEVNNLWTGEEKQKVQYWAHPVTIHKNGQDIEVNGITVNDLEIVTPEMLTELNIIN